MGEVIQAKVTGDLICPPCLSVLPGDSNLYTVYRNTNLGRHSEARRPHVRLVHAYQKSDVTPTNFITAACEFLQIDLPRHLNRGHTPPLRGSAVVEIRRRVGARKGFD